MIKYTHLTTTLILALVFIHSSVLARDKCKEKPEGSWQEKCWDLSWRSCINEEYCCTGAVVRCGVTTGSTDPKKEYKNGAQQYPKVSEHLE